MKKILLMMVIWCLLLSLCACTSTPANTSYTSIDRGEYEFESGIPFQMNYNGKELTVSNISAYEQYTSHQYTLYVVVKIDASDLTDDELYWLQKDDIDADLSITCEDNNMENDSMSLLGSLRYTDTKQLNLVYYTSFFHETRYSFAGSRIKCSFRATQKEKYEYEYNGEKQSSKKVNVAYYTYDVPENLEDPEVALKGTTLFEYMNEWLAQILKNLQDLASYY